MLYGCVAPQQHAASKVQIPIEDDVPGADGALVRAIRQGDSQAAETALQAGANPNLRLCFIPARPGYDRYGVFNQNPECRPGVKANQAGVPILDFILWRSAEDKQASLISTLARHGARWDTESTTVLGQLANTSSLGAPQDDLNAKVATVQALVESGFMFSPTDIRAEAGIQERFQRKVSLAVVQRVAVLTHNTQAYEAGVKDADAEQQAREQHDEQVVHEKQMAEKQAIEQDRVVGTQICRTEQGISRPMIGTALGQPMYGRGVQSNYYIVGFTEGTTPTKIKVRINSIQSSSATSGVVNIDHLDGNPQLNVNGVIFDNPANWRPCE
jgi:hypothetical protein